MNFRIIPTRYPARLFECGIQIEIRLAVVGNTILILPFNTANVITRNFNAKFIGAGWTERPARTIVEVTNLPGRKILK